MLHPRIGALQRLIHAAKMHAPFLAHLCKKFVLEGLPKILSMNTIICKSGYPVVPGKPQGTKPLSKSAYIESCIAREQ